LAYFNLIKGEEEEEEGEEEVLGGMEEGEGAQIKGI
jgi:hypothetical protein